MKAQEPKRIEVQSEGKVYVFQLEILLRPEQLEQIRQQLIQQVKEGVVLLSPYIRLVETRPEDLGKEW